MTNVIELIFVAVHAIGSYPHFTGWCPVHLDNTSGGRRSLHIDFADKGIGIMDAFFHCRSCGANGIDVAEALGFSCVSDHVIPQSLGLAIK